MKHLSVMCRIRSFRDPFKKENSIMAEINLLDKLPQTKRNLKKRLEEKTAEDREIAKKFGQDFFDGERKYGYGGYRYDGRWLPVAERLVDFYDLPEDAKILDVGCAKGFLMYDFKQVLPNATVRGIDVSEYARENAHEGMMKYIDIGSAEELPYSDGAFDLVVSINSIHNLPLEQCKQSLKEMERVSKGGKFLSVDAWRTKEEEQAVLDWILTAQTYMSVEDWEVLFNEVGYTGDYWWFIP